MTSPMSAVNMGNQRYFDVYLDDPSSSDEDEYIEHSLSRPLMSPWKYTRRFPSRPVATSTNTPDTKLPKRRPVWYYKRKKDCLQAFYIVMIIMVIIVFSLVLLRILKDAAKHHTADDEQDKSNKLSGIAALGNFAISQPFGVKIGPKPSSTPPTFSPPKKPAKIKLFPQLPKPHVPIISGPVGPIPHSGHAGSQRTVVPCTKYAVQDVWIKNIPQLMVESGIRLLDVNDDGVLDAVIGFATDVNAYFADEYLMCSIYFNGQTPCFGGVLALDGISGQELWRHYTNSEVFAVNCNGDVTGDRVNDCAIAGRAGVMEMVSGVSGQRLWKYVPADPDEALSNFYTAQFIHDINDDGVKDVLNIQGGDPVRKPGAQVRYSGKLMLFSGADGHVITLSTVPDEMESYYSPQIYYQRGGKGMVLFGTGGETIGGSLWALPLDDLIEGKMENARAIFTDPVKGIMVPPVLIDLTRDGIMDIVMSMFNSVVAAFDGQSFRQLWNHTIPTSESYSTPSPAYYNDDNVPDFMVVYNYGPGYPLYYYAQVLILDGRNGQPLLHKPIISSGSVTSSPLTVSSEGYGNDTFLFWKLDCEGHEGETTPFQFANSNEDGIGELSKTDFCHQRFNAPTFSSLNLLNQHMEGAGKAVYNSRHRFEEEHRYEVNATILAMKFLVNNPEVISTVLGAQKSQHEHVDQSTPAATTMKPMTSTPARDALSTAADFQSEYDRLMAKLSSLSHSLGDTPEVTQASGTVPAKVVTTTPSTNTPVDGLVSSREPSSPTPQDIYITDPRLPHADKDHSTVATTLGQTSVRIPKLTGVTQTTSVAEVDPILDEDIASKLKNLGFPESWFEKDKDEGVDTLEEELGDRDEKEEDVSNEDVDLLLKLLGIDKETGDRASKIDRAKRDGRPLASRNKNYEKRRVMAHHKRARRHAGLHDAGGIQRVISTGTLAPPLSPVLDDTPRNANSIDLIFATYWFYPKPHEIITAEEKKCLDSWMSSEEQRMDPSNEYYGMDHDGYEHLGSEYCSKKAKAAPTPAPEQRNPLDIYPFNLDAGEMTVYRLRLSCECDIPEAEMSSSGKDCPRILPFNQQQWGAYMGTYGNGYFRMRSMK